MEPRGYLFLLESLVFGNGEISRGLGGFRCRQVFEDVEGCAGQTNQENRRNAVRHALSKTKREETDNSESLREARLFRG